MSFLLLTQPAVVRTLLTTLCLTAGAALARTDGPDDAARAAAQAAQAATATAGQAAPQADTAEDAAWRAALPASGRGNQDEVAQLAQRRRMAQSALMRHHPAQALAIANAGLQHAPDDARLRFIKGVALNQLKRLPEAEAVFMALIDEYPELPEPYNNLAVIRAAQGRLEDARDALEASIRAVPDYTVAHENLGDLYAELAIRNWQQALAASPNRSTLKRKLERVQSALGQRPAPSASGRANR
ncbi:MAG: tetratricopeptide repeat protein [Lautropia sp.]|nr:tetratricopeptide repeat protein [Lautropia sp.]